MAHWVHGDDTPMMSWCRAQILTTAKLLRQTYTDATSSGLTRGHECDVAGAFHLRSKMLPVILCCIRILFPRVFGIRRKIFADYIRNIHSED